MMNLCSLMSIFLYLQNIVKNGVTTISFKPEVCLFLLENKVHCFLCRQKTENWKMTPIPISKTYTLSLLKYILPHSYCFFNNKACHPCTLQIDIWHRRSLQTHMQIIYYFFMYKEMGKYFPWSSSLSRKFMGMLERYFIEQILVVVYRNHICFKNNMCLPHQN